VEKDLEYNIVAHFCFIELEKAFDKLELERVIEILERTSVSNKLAILIKNIYTNNFTRVTCDRKISGKLPIQKGIKQGDSSSPLLFNLLMNEIIKVVNSKKEGRMCNKGIKISRALCSADYL
jgi:hypothetical protein